VGGGGTAFIVGGMKKVNALSKHVQRKRNRKANDLGENARQLNRKGWKRTVFRDRPGDGARGPKKQRGRQKGVQKREGRHPARVSRGVRGGCADNGALSSSVQGPKKEPNWCGGEGGV